jgi:hypothetical protein
MSVELASEIWSEIKRYVNSVDRNEAAETLVSVLIDNDVSAEEIKSAFKGDGDIKRALADYLKGEEELEEEEEDSYDDDDY